MAKKQILTNTDIEKDIIDALKKPPKESEASYKRWTVISIIAAAVLVVMEFVYPLFIVWCLLAVIVFLIGYCTVYHFRMKSQIKNVTVGNYDITEETVHSTDEEHYRAERGGSVRHRRTVEVNNYAIRFESGRVWQIPKELYCRSERLRMHDREICASVHRGDTMIVVSEKSTGKIVVAYSTEIFMYKG